MRKLPQMNTIDFAKFIFAFCVIGIHTNLLEQTSDEMNWMLTHLIFRLAVPFFYVVTGYFLGRKLFLQNDYEKILRNYRKKLYLPLAVWGGWG